MKLPDASEKVLLATKMDACVAPLLSGEKTAVYEEAEPEKSEREPLETEISASVKSEDSSERVKKMRAVLPTSTEDELEDIAMVGGVAIAIPKSLLIEISAPTVTSIDELSPG